MKERFEPEGSITNTECTKPEPQIVDDSAVRKKPVRENQQVVATSQKRPTTVLANEQDPRLMFQGYGYFGRTPTERIALIATLTLAVVGAGFAVDHQVKKSNEKAAKQKAYDHLALQKKIAEEEKKKEDEELSKQTVNAKMASDDAVFDEHDAGVPPPVIPESVWTTRQPGEIKKGEVIYSPVTGPDGKEKLASLQFEDKDGQTFLIMNEKKLQQTSRGFPVFIRKIMLGADGKITIEGTILRGLSGVSTWDAKKISKLNDDVEYDGKSEYTVTTFFGEEKGLIQRYVEPDVAASEDAPETEPAHKSK